MQLMIHFHVLKSWVDLTVGADELLRAGMHSTGCM